MATPSTTLFVVGLPAEFTEDHIKVSIGQYGVVQSAKILPLHPGSSDIACLCTMTSVEEAQWIVENLNGNIPHGLAKPITVIFASSSQGGTSGSAGILPSYGKSMGGLGAIADTRFAAYGGGAATSRPQAGTTPVANGLLGTIGEDKGKFGFIKQDSGEKDMFCLAPLPPTGTRVVYNVIQDKTGRLRADNLQCADGSPIVPAAVALIGAAFPAVAAAAMAGGGVDWSRLSAVYGSLVADAGITGVGASVGLAIDDGLPPGPTTLSPGAEKNVGLPMTTPTEFLLTGTVSSNKGQFGFIKQDNGDADMFCMPQSCVEFGKVLPEVGTRVTYKVVVDSKTRKSRADCVVPAKM